MTATKGTITDGANRDALLDYLDLNTDIADVVNRYQHLSVFVVAQTLIAKAHEAMAAASLPQAYGKPQEDAPK